MQNRTAQESPSTEETAIHTSTLKHTFHPLSPFNFLLVKKKKKSLKVRYVLLKVWEEGYHCAGMNDVENELLSSLHVSSRK